MGLFDWFSDDEQGSDLSPSHALNADLMDRSYEELAALAAEASGTMTKIDVLMQQYRYTLEVMPASDEAERRAIESAMASLEQNKDGVRQTRDRLYAISEIKREGTTLLAAYQLARDAGLSGRGLGLFPVPFILIAGVVAVAGIVIWKYADAVEALRRLELTLSAGLKAQKEYTNCLSAGYSTEQCRAGLDAVIEAAVEVGKEPTSTTTWFVWAAAGLGGFYLFLKNRKPKRSI